MRKVLLLNGSHKTEKSYTMKISRQFACGLKKYDPETEVTVVNLFEKKIDTCTACHDCWTKTPGECVFQDDMADLLEQYMDSELVIWSTPLYYHGTSSVLKKFLERTQPILLPYIDQKDFRIYRHPYRYPERMKEKKHVLISTCGYPSKEHNYEGLEGLFDNLFAADQLLKIICTEGELLDDCHQNDLTEPYLNLVKMAGQEYAEKHRISRQFSEGLSKPFIEIRDYLKAANFSWGVDDVRMKDADEGLIAWDYMKKVKAAFNPKIRPKMNAVLQIDFLDIKERYQLVIKDETCTLLHNNFVGATAAINVTLAILERIFEGKIDPTQALIEKKYSVMGDQRVYNAFLDGLFGPLTFEDPKSELLPIRFKNTPYWFFLGLLPWMLCFLFADYNTTIAVMIPLALSGVLCSIKRGVDQVYFESCTLLFFSVTGIISVTFGSAYEGSTYAIMGCFALAFIWAVSTLRAAPLSADYLHFFSGRNAQKNALFLKTNRIICYVWSMVFLIQAGITLWLKSTFLTAFSATIPALLVIPTFIFSLWFRKWYPAKRARSK